MPEHNTQRDLLSDDWEVALDPSATWSDAVLYGPHVPISDIAPHARGARALDCHEVSLPSTTNCITADYHGVSWWARDVTIPFASDDIVVRFGGARLAAEVYWDDQLVGYDLDGYSPFDVRIPGRTAEGGHRLDVRITNPGGSTGWEDILPISWGDHRLASSHDFGGLWQPVEIVTGTPGRIRDVAISAELSGAVRLRVAAELASGSRIVAEVCDPGGTTVAETQVTLRAPARHHEFALMVDEPELYGPGSPHVYRVRVTTTTAGGGDVAEEPFGFRRLDVEDGQLLLNGEPFYLRTAISWGRYRNGPIADADELQEEMNSLLAIGNNALSAHRAPATTALLDAAERHGILIHQEPGGVPSLYRSASETLGLEWLHERVRRLVRRDRSRASVVWWNLANEAAQPDGGEPGPVAAQLLQTLREQDDSRLTTWTSAWGPTPMFRPGDARRYWSFDFHTIIVWPSTWNPRVASEVAALGCPDDTLFLSGESATFPSLGGVDGVLARSAAPQPAYERWRDKLTESLALLDPEGRISWERLQDESAAVQTHGIARLVEATRANPSVDGLAINGWHSHPEVGGQGVTTLDRRLAVEPTALHHANAPATLYISGLSPQVRVGDDNVFDVVIVSDHELDADCEIVLALNDERLHVRPRRTSRRTWAVDGLSTSAHGPGPTTIEMSAVLPTCRGTFTATTSTGYLAVRPPELGTRPVHLFDPSGDLTDWLEGQGCTTERLGIWSDAPGIVNATNLAAMHMLFQGEPRRTVVFPDSRRGLGNSGLLVPPMGYMTLGALGLTEPTGMTPIPVHGIWVGGWAFTIDHGPLPSLGPAGVWDWGHAPTFPQTAVAGLRGRALAGAASFPHANMLTIGDPLAGATITILRRGQHEVMLSLVPVTQTLIDSPLSQALLAEMIAWVHGESDE